MVIAGCLILGVVWSVGWSAGQSSGQSAVGIFGCEFVQWSVVGWSVACSAVTFHLLSNNQPWSDAFLAEQEG